MPRKRPTNPRSETGDRLESAASNPYVKPAIGFEPHAVPPRLATLARRIATAGPRDHNVPLSSFITKIAQQSARTEKRLGHAVDAWTQLVPPELAAESRIDTIRGGTLHVVVRSSPSLWTIDRLLRGGLGDLLVREIGPPVRQIRLIIGTIDPEADTNGDDRRRPRW